MTKISKHLPSGTLQSRCLRGGAIFWWGGTCKFHSSSFPFRHTENKGAWFTFCKTIRFWILFLQTFEVHRCQNRVYPSLTVRRETLRRLILCFFRLLIKTILWQIINFRRCLAPRGLFLPIPNLLLFATEELRSFRIAYGATDESPASHKIPSRAGLT